MLRQIMKAILPDPVVLAAPLQTQLDKRPFSQTILSSQNFSLSTVQKVALGLLAAPPVLVFLGSLLSGQWLLLLISGFILLLIALMRWIINLRSQMVWIATWHHDSVEVEDGRYGKFDHWIEPLNAFTGLKHVSGLLPRAGLVAANRRVHGLVLVHPNPFKSILLHADTSPIKDEKAAYYQRQLKQKLIR